MPAFGKLTPNMLLRMPWWATTTVTAASSGWSVCSWSSQVQRVATRAGRFSRSTARLASTCSAVWESTASRSRACRRGHSSVVLRVEAGRTVSQSQSPRSCQVPSTRTRTGDGAVGEGRCLSHWSRMSDADCRVRSDGETTSWKSGEVDEGLAVVGGDGSGVEVVGSVVGSGVGSWDGDGGWVDTARLTWATPVGVRQGSRIPR
mmetsp:Transcript_246/g.780  ORF Transcript_246/g.780 Transcript_246/m.780 type:complete len:204 (+) Transcript_246:1043-1654(+)